MTGPLFNHPDQRGAGVLLHPSSFPNDTGIGNFGKSAYTFIDFLADAGMSYWQVFPLGPTGYGNSPYQCFSSFAGNPYFIDWRALIKDGLLKEEDLKAFPPSETNAVDYSEVFYQFWPLLTKAYKAYTQKPITPEGYTPLDQFVIENAFWLTPYTFFKALKDHFGGQPWQEWPEDFRTYEKASQHPLLEEKKDVIGAYTFAQYLFHNQWHQLKRYANSKNIQIIGDIPIFVALDSSDTWTYPHLFQLKENGAPESVAGVPPDYFSPTGQLWGNPLYNWPKMAEDNYAWWKMRLKHNFKLYDIVRLDHFRGFQDYWSVPADAKDATHGSWKKGPGLAFFKAIQEELGKDTHMIAEDLGLITEDVRELRRAAGMPSMAVLQFAFDGDPKNPHLPDNYTSDTVVYPATHDNDTAWGWYNTLAEEEKDRFRSYLSISGDDVPWDMIRACYNSDANITIIQLQDLLGLGPETRMNTPGTLGEHNWSWRYEEEQLDRLHAESAQYLLKLSKENNRA